MYKYTLVLYIILNIISYLLGFFEQDPYNLILNALPDGNKNDTVPMVRQRVKWWPSGVPQGWTTIGTALATYGALSKLPGVSPRLRVLGALGSAGVTTANITYHSALENSLGFNRLMWGLSEYKKTGSWPSLEQTKNITENQLKDFNTEAAKSVDVSTVDKVVSEVKNQNNLIDTSNIGDSLVDLMFKSVIQIIKPVEVNGYLDDLIGQRMAIEVILLVMCLSIILLFLFLLTNILFIMNKEWLNKKLSRVKLISLYLKYQEILSKLALIYVPILILISLVTLFHGLHWLIVNQIPYESLNVDLHQYISNKHK